MSTRNFNALTQNTGESTLLTLGGMGSNMFGSASVIHTLPGGQNGNIPSEPSFLDQQLISNAEIHDFSKTNSTVQFSVKNLKGPDVLRNIKEKQKAADAMKKKQEDARNIQMAKEGLLCEENWIH